MLHLDAIERKNFISELSVPAVINAFYGDILALRAQLILFVPILMACGIGVYFSLGFEPPFYVGPAVFILSSLALFFTKGWARVFVFAVFMAALGFCAAQARAHLVYTPMLEREMDFAEVQGDIEEIEVLEKGARILLSSVAIEELEADKTPRQIRLKVRDESGLRIGQRVSALAGLNPPSAPVIPRGFDFQRYMYFQGIGAVGFTYRDPEIVEQARSFGGIEALRGLIAERIRGSVDAPADGIALALIVGQRRAIAEGDVEAIRAAGLAHMLAISGLHIGLFSGVLFFAFRGFMALFPSFALRHPIKKYAAIIAMAGALFYMLIAGASIPSQRAMITVAIIFSAVLLDRSAISLRVVACAAALILLFFPESLMSVSFQMSFAAVTCLVAFYDWLRPVWSRWHRGTGVLRRAGLYFFGISMTTVVATIATAPFTLFHFQTLPSYGLLANLVCVPLLGMVIMPLAVLGLALMPFGLEGIVFMVMQPALSWILDMAHFVNGLDGAVLRDPQAAFPAFLFCVLAGLSLIVLRGRLRVVCALVCACAAIAGAKVRPYDALISAEFELVGFFVGPDFYVSSLQKESFVRENWERMAGLTPGAARKFPSEGRVEGGDASLTCGEGGCRYERGGSRISYLTAVDPQSVTEACGWADIVIARFVDAPCANAVLINNRATSTYGAYALIEGDAGHDGALVLERSEDFRGARPWVQ